MTSDRHIAPAAASTDAVAGATDGGGTPARMLVLATVGFFVNFWAWALISPLGATYRDELDLSSLQQAFLVAVPVVVGSLGRIPVGALTDRFGARTMFPIVSALTVLPVLYIGLVADSYPELVVGGFVLGLGGTTFAIGIPLVNAWFPPQRRGLALGVFGAGMGGTALSAFTTVALADAYGRAAPFLLVAVLLLTYTAVAAVLLRDAPGRVPATGSFLARTWRTARLPVTGQLSLLYAVGFGGFVAFSVYLPTYLRNAFDLSPQDAAMRTAGFVVLAVALRPVGGWLSDRFGPVPVLTACFLVAAVLAAVTALELPLMPVGTVAFLGLAAALGASSGAVFALVAVLSPPDKVGGVTGLVGAAGGLGGFVPPLVMGAIYGATGDYSLGLALLAVVAAGTAWFTWGPVRRTARQARTEERTST
jgi:MFS transporter, NNP family, nitrate/nitrite transporter